MLFSKIVKKITDKVGAKAIEIQDELNNFLDEMSLTTRYDSMVTIDLSAEANLQEIAIPEDIIQIHQVYVDDERIYSTMTMQKYIEETYTENLECMISNESKIIYFPVSLVSGTNVLTLWSRKSFTNSTSLLGTDDLDIKDHYIVALVDYILKELYLSDNYYNADKYLLYSRRFEDDKMTLKTLDVNGESANTITIKKSQKPFTY